MDAKQHASLDAQTCLNDFGCMVGNRLPEWENQLYSMNWHPVVFLVLYVALALYFLLRGAAGAPYGEPRRTWAAVILLVLGFNTVLQLDFLMSVILRTWVHHGGWYAYRRPVQYFFIALIALLTFRWLRSLRARKAHLSQNEWFLVVTLVLLVLLVVVRTISAHHIDSVMNSRLLGISINRIVEFALISLAAFGAMKLERHSPDDHV